MVKTLVMILSNRIRDADHLVGSVRYRIYYCYILPLYLTCFCDTCMGLDEQI